LSHQPHPALEKGGEHAAIALRMKKFRTILVTGAAGFVGGHLVEALLARGYRVVCVDLFTYAGSLAHLAPAMAAHRHRIVDRVCRPEWLRQRSTRLIILRGDINDGAVLAGLLAACDGIMALAAETHVDYSYHSPGAFVRANINGTHTLLEVLRHAAPGKRLLHVSTDEVYGERSRGRSPESAPLQPRNIYAATKACGELLVRAYADVFGLDVVTVRPCNLIGPRQQPKDLVPKTFSYLLHGRKMTIHGDGQHVREYLYVRDAVEMMIDVLERGRRGEVYNLCSQTRRSTLQVVRAIARSLGRPPRSVITFVPDRPNPDRRYAGDNGKIRRLLGRRWQPTPFAQVIKIMRDDFIARRPPPLD
jgi:dTDP-glucose 4,6-dehydratase